MVKLATPLQAASRPIRAGMLRVCLGEGGKALSSFVCFLLLYGLRIYPKDDIHEQSALIRCDSLHWLQGM